MEINIQNEAISETPSSTEEDGEIQCKRIKLCKKKRGKKKKHSCETDVSQEFNFKTSAMMMLAFTDDWDVDVYCDVSTTTIEKDKNGNTPDLKNRMITTKIGKLNQIDEIKTKLKRNALGRPKVDFVKVKEDYLSITKRTNISSEMNLDDYHRWMKRDESPIFTSKTLQVLKENYSSRWDPLSEANRQNSVRLVSNPTVVLGKILEELNYKQSISDLRHDSDMYVLNLSILSKPKWAFFGTGPTRNDALEDASQYAIQFLLIMSV